jgi:predicted RNA-binding Zn ribbon-like protein
MPVAAPQAGHAPAAGAAPGQLEQVRLFVNTLDIELGTDELSTPEALTDWLAAHGLLPRNWAQPLASAADVRQAVALREALRAVLLSHLGATAPNAPADLVVAGGVAVPGGPAAELRRIAGSLRAVLDVSDDGRVAAAPAGTGPAAALTKILLIAADAAVTGAWSRLKVCGADDCRWAFYDRSPTRNGCWCSMAVCGARAKSRAYRRRTAARRPASAAST